MGAPKSQRAAGRASARKVKICDGDIANRYADAAGLPRAPASLPRDLPLATLLTACRITIEASIMCRYIDFGVGRARPDQDHLRLPSSGQISERMK
jgi:hypothetical protein